MHQQHQMELALAANQVAMLQRTTCASVAPEQFAAWSEQFGTAAAMSAQEQWQLATAYGPWPMGQLPFVPPSTHAAVTSTATTPATLLPLPVRCTPYHPPVSRPHAASLTDSAMAMDGLAHSLRKASKTAVASGSNYGNQAPTDDAECKDAKDSTGKVPNPKGLAGSAGKDSNEVTSVITPDEHQDDFSASAAPVEDTAAPGAKAGVGLPSKRKRCEPAAATRQGTTSFQRGNRSGGLTLKPERQRRGRPESETTGDKPAPSARSSTHCAVSRPLTDREKSRVSSHVATEQRRRDRINESFRVLREIVPHSDKTDKASFLGEVTAYIRKLQRLVGSTANGLGRPSGADSAIIGDSTSVAQES